MKRGSTLDFFFRSFRKDMRYSFFPFLRGSLGPIVILFLIIMGVANAFAFTEDKPTERFNPREYSTDYEFHGLTEYRENNTADDTNGESEEEIPSLGERGASVVSVVGYLIFLIQASFLISFHVMIFSKERKEGTIRSYFHYDLSYRKVMISKMSNVIIMTFLVTILLTLLTLPLLLAWKLPATVFLGMVVLSSLFLFGQYVFFFSLAGTLTKVSRWKKLVVDPLLFFLIGNVIFLLLTETAIFWSYKAMAELFSWSGGTPGIIILRYLSPVHTFGKLIDLLVLGRGINILDFIWLPVFIAFVSVSPFVMKRIYPDVFIKETA